MRAAVSFERQEELVDLFRTAFAEPLPRSADLSLSNGNLKITSKWAFQDMDMEKKVTFETVHLAMLSENDERTLGLFRCIDPAVEVNETIISSTKSRGTQGLRALYKTITKGEKKMDFLEIWNEARRLYVYDIEASELHGNMITKGFQWSRSEEKFLFVAEKKVPKSESFFCRKPAPDCEQGTKYRWDEDWGEQLEGVITPVVVVLTLPKGLTFGGSRTKETAALQVQVIEMDNASCGQAVFTPDEKGVIFVGMVNEPYRLGSVFCDNRLQQLYHYDLESKAFTEIGDKNKCIRSPRFTAMGKHLVYLQNEVGGPHEMTSELISIEWSTKTKQVVVPIPEKPGVNEFPGLYTTKGLLQYCTSDDGNFLYVETQWHSRAQILQIDLDSKAIVNITASSPVDVQAKHLLSWNLLSVNGNYILASCSSLTETPSLVVGKQHPSTNKIVWNYSRPSTSEEPGDEADKTGLTIRCGTRLRPTKLSGYEIEVLQLRPDEDQTQYFEAIYVYPKATKHCLIVMPHGGPHAMSSIAYRPDCEFLLNAGYGVLLINYRGSLGFGEANLRALPGRIGDVDVTDVQMAVKQAKSRGLVTQSVLWGASHGGFIVAHLVGKSGQYPSDYAACCLHNPVVDMSMLGPTDIPDWYWFEGGCRGPFRYDSLPTDEDLMKLRACSPIAHAHKIKTPCFFFLGSVDKRVDKGQGLKLYKHLQGRGVKTRCNMYNDNHSLSTVGHDGDEFVNSVLWFDRFTRGTPMESN
ncbi:acylamino-acid-releasing enzyme-like [Tropilaelaps mercedesae]|uniref:acylaminoacyl-peptidase n=1 Tax=Tropilaelaps mercedesae TaxID=418985 RepID=A0A1V9XHX7_9ACAR|nr:acylamino-acid-releasing enzyme-like [Tropilaelaps mercedesae]